VLTLREVAQIVGMHRDHLRKLCGKGLVPGAVKQLSQNDKPRFTWYIPESSLDKIKPRPLGAPKGVLRSPTRKLIQRLMLKGHKLTMQEICQQVGCSHQLARKYLKEIGAVRSPQTKWWSIPPSTD
jgi:AraC-like DNA-binding protein